MLRNLPNHLQFIHNRHHSEHEQSVSKAKQSLQERLALLEGQQQSGQYSQSRYGNAYGSSGSEKYVTGCSSCASVGGSENYSSRYTFCDQGETYFSINLL